MARRRLWDRRDAGTAAMNRLYVVETAVTPTGARADHRLSVPARQVEEIARALAGRLGISVQPRASGALDEWLGAVANDLKEHAGRSVVLAGPRQPATVHLLAHALNHHLKNIGQTVLHTAPIEVQPVNQTDSLRQLAQDMEQGKVEVLVILGGNPVYTAPADFDFTACLQKVPLRFHLSLYQDETSRQCHWHLPEAHYLESWGDTRAYEGTASIAQPLIEPLYHGRSSYELMAVLADGLGTPPREIVRSYWQRHHKALNSSGDFETFWETSLHDGVIAGTKFPSRSVSL
jgi:molybdopterin-containing oxidoreductase family iron-sulfur binding subunit